MDIEDDILMAVVGARKSSGTNIVSELGFSLGCPEDDADGSNEGGELELNVG